MKTNGALIIFLSLFIVLHTSSAANQAPVNNLHEDATMNISQANKEDHTDKSSQFELGDDGYWRDKNDGARIREIWTFDEEGNRVQMTMEQYLELIK